MKKLIALLLVLIVHYGSCTINGIYINTGGCPNYTPATNIHVEEVNYLEFTIFQS